MIRDAVTESSAQDLVCFSHLRWNFVFQRPQHILSRATRRYRVVFWEEPIGLDAGPACLELVTSKEGVLVVTPRVPWNVHWAVAQRALLDEFLAARGAGTPMLWYYTPAALAFSAHVRGRPVIYDCMDELAAFDLADPDLPAHEQALLDRAEIVFTGGQALYEAKCSRHGNVHAMPSGVDLQHFAPARSGLPDPEDQASIPFPRAGFFGVLDERLDQDLLARVADLRPGIQFIMVGPIAKIDAAALPQRPNIHYLGSKEYAALPAYVGNWDVALMPFALNAATRFISPTKTPEYLAAGRPVVSTPITDVVRQYGDTGFVQVAAEPAGFAAAIDRALTLKGWQPAADAMLSDMSWDGIWSRMAELVERPQASRRVAGRTVAMRVTPAAVLRRTPYDTLVVGAGFAGSVLAERLAAGSGERVLLVDRRSHVGGNAYDVADAAGVLIHPYGPHIFHTNAQVVVDYLSRFTAWHPYEHRVLADLGAMRLPMPINRTTVNRFFGLDLREADVAAFLASKAEPRDPVRTAADVVLGTVGTELYEAFFRGYTRKQWGLDPHELDRSVTARVPTRTTDDDRYFTDRFQQMPLHGYTRMFQAMLDHPGITVSTATEYTDVPRGSYDRLVFTGPVDEFFGHRFGRLPYRSLRFRHETLDVARHQEVGVVNYPSESVPFTRVTEFKHLTGQRHPQTSLCYEYPATDGDPYYPIPRPENAALYQRYQALADATPNVHFVGRLATYRYYNMDQVVGQALATYARIAKTGAIAKVAAE